MNLKWYIEGSGNDPWVAVLFLRFKKDHTMIPRVAVLDQFVCLKSMHMF